MWLSRIQYLLNFTKCFDSVNGCCNIVTLNRDKSLSYFTWIPVTNWVNLGIIFFNMCCRYSFKSPRPGTHLCCGYSLESPHWGNSKEYPNNEYPQLMFLWRNYRNLSLNYHQISTLSFLLKNAECQHLCRFELPVLSKKHKFNQTHYMYLSQDHSGLLHPSQVLCKGKVECIWLFPSIVFFFFFFFK